MGYNFGKGSLDRFSENSSSESAILVRDNDVQKLLMIIMYLKRKSDSRIFTVKVMKKSINKK